MKVLPWLVLLTLIVLISIYLLGELADARTDQFYARAHLTEVKADARSDYINSMMPILYMVTVVVVVAGATVIVVALIIGGGLGLFTILRYFESRDRLGPPVTLVQIGSGQREEHREVYQIPSRVIDMTARRR